MQGIRKFRKREEGTLNVASEGIIQMHTVCAFMVPNIQRVS